MDRSRRAFLKRAGAVAVGVGVAGCSGESGDGTETDAGGTEAGETTAAEQTTAETETESTGTASTGTAESKEGTVVTAESTNGLNITEHDFFHAGDAAGVEGVVENTTDETFEYVEVTVSPLDESEQRLGKFYASSVSQNVDTLPPGETWNFVVSFESGWVEQFETYEIWATGKVQAGGTETETTATEQNTTRG